MTRPRVPGLRANAVQFGFLVLVNAFVGGMVGLERAILPQYAEEVFGLVARSAVLSFIAVFGVSKALSNYGAGRLADRYGRRPVLIAGWVVAAPVPWLMMYAPSWNVVLLANVLLGVSQGLTWSTAVIMKIDLAGPRRRGLAMGINEFAGYAAVAAAAWGSAWLAAKYGVRPTPFYLGVLFVVLGLGLSVWPVRETRDLVDLARPNVDARSSAPAVPRNLLWHASFGRRDLNAIAQAGMVNNLNDGVVWGLIPFMLAARGHSLEAIGTLVAIYPAVWGLAQLPAGAWSDRVGRRPLIVVGMVLQSVALAMLLLWLTWLGVALSMVFLGLGTALVYPTLLAAIADATPPSWRGSAVGVYRLWRDGGYAVGALGGGAIADLYGSETAVGVAAGLTLASGLFVALRLRPPAPEPETQTEPDYSSAAAL